MTIFIEPSTSNRPRTRSQKDSSFLGVVTEMNPEALTKKGRAEVKKTQIKKSKKSSPKKWSVDEDANLIDELLSSTEPIDQIANRHRRSPAAIKQRVIHILPELRFRIQMVIKTKFVLGIVTHALVAVTAYALGNHPDAIPLPQISGIGVST
jgi:hypothetical protein